MKISYIYILCEISIRMSSSFLEGKFERAIKTDDVDTVQEILSFDISPNILFSFGKRPIHLAIIFDSMKVALLLANHPSIELNMPDKNGTTPLFLAKSISSRKYVSLLLLKGALTEERGISSDDDVKRKSDNVKVKKTKKKALDKENNQVFVLSKIKYAVPDIGEKVEEHILKESCTLLELPVLGEHDINDARGVRRRKSLK